MSGPVIEIARLLLAAVFAVAGLAKLADRRGSRQAARDFGAPERLAGAVALLLPLAELVIATALVPSASARVAAGVAAAILILFTLLLARAVIRGRRLDCHCFGRLTSTPAGWGTVARNAALAAFAIAILSQPASTLTWLEAGAAGVVAVVVGQALLSYALLRRYGHALRRLEELEARPTQHAALEVGAEAPAFELPSVAGGKVGLGALLARGGPALLVFADPGCGPCRTLMPQIAMWQRHAERMTVAIVSSGDTEANVAMAGAHGLRDVLLQEAAEVGQLYGVTATPSAVLIGSAATIEHALVAGSRAIEKLVASPAPDPEPSDEHVGNERARVATAAALGGGLAASAAATHAAAHSRTGPPADPELEAIDAVLRAAGPKLVAAARRSLKATRARATLRTGKKARAKRAAAKRSLVAERREVLALRAEVEQLPATSVTANNVKAVASNSLTLLAQSLEKRERAIGSSPKIALRLLSQSQQLFLRSLGSNAAAGRLLGRGQ